jgi:hypothetical protein
MSRESDTQRIHVRVDGVLVLVFYCLLAKKTEETCEIVDEVARDVAGLDGLRAICVRRAGNPEGLHFCFRQEVVNRLWIAMVVNMPLLRPSFVG